MTLRIFLIARRTHIFFVTVMGTTIQQFYYKKSIFLTGATGFMGKVLLDKVLRTCDIDTFFVMVRNKKGKGMQSRIEEIFDDPVSICFASFDADLLILCFLQLFNRLKREKPKFRNKIVGIYGDCILPGLGINSDDRTLLSQKVQIGESK